MKQTTKTLLGLLVLLLLAGAIGGAALWTGKDEQKKAEAKEKSEKLFDFDKSQVKELRLSKEGQLVARMEKSDKGWKLLEPVRADGDDTVVDSLVGTLSTLKQKKDLGEEKDLKAFGLDQPRLEVALKLDGGKDLGLQVGIDNGFDGTLYVKKHGEAMVRVIDAYQKASFEKTAFDLRDKRVAHLDDGAEVKRIEATGVKWPYPLEKDGTVWKLGGAPADGAAADRIASAVKSLRATAVGSEAAKGLKEYGLDKQILADVEKEAFDLQNKELVHVDREAIRKVVFESPPGKVEITRVKNFPEDGGVADEVFTVVAPQQGPAKKWKVSSALYAIASLRATAFEGPLPAAKDLARYGLDKPRTVTLLGEGDKVLARVRIGSEKVGNRFALVLLATKRARQLMAGARPLIEAKDKPPVLALREVATGKVRFDRPVRAALEGQYDHEKLPVGPPRR